jgi:hypothetical protein
LDGGIVATGHDFSRLDARLPHPVYTAMSWMCVLSPSAETFEKVVPPLPDEAHALGLMNRTWYHREGM